MIVGDGPLRGSLESEVLRLGIRDQVTFAGFRRHIAGMYSLMNMVVLPSLGEGLPVTLLEAMAMGKPTVATRVGGVPEVVQDGQEGIIVPPEDPASLRSAMARILDDDVLSEKLGRAAAVTVRRRFSAEALEQRTRQVYRGALGRA